MNVYEEIRRLAMWGIAKLKENVPLSHFPVSVVRQEVLDYCRVLNEEHRNGNTGQVFKLIQIGHANDNK